jgi:hypothetical protein
MFKTNNQRINSNKKGIFFTKQLKAKKNNVPKIKK